METLKAIDSSVPVFAFVDEKVMHDYYVYQKNKEIVGQIRFPSIERPESAKYVFEFISFLSQRGKGNSVISFAKLDDIETHLRKQWGALFQRLLREQREESSQSRKMFTISEQLEDLKTALLSTMTNAQSRDVARGVIKYRRLVDFLSGIHLADPKVVTSAEFDFDELLARADIEEVRDVPAPSTSFGRTALVKTDGTFYEVRFSKEYLPRISVDWQSFTALQPDVRQVIFEAITDMGQVGPGVIRYRSERFEDYFSDKLEKEGDNVPMSELLRVVLGPDAEQARQPNPTE